jgi:hypothetical protein
VTSMDVALAQKARARNIPGRGPNATRLAHPQERRVA